MAYPAEAQIVGITLAETPGVYESRTIFLAAAQCKNDVVEQRERKKSVSASMYDSNNSTRDSDCLLDKIKWLRLKDN